MFKALLVASVALSIALSVAGTLTTGLTELNQDRYDNILTLGE